MKSIVCTAIVALSMCLGTSRSAAQHEEMANPQEMLKKMQEHATPGEKHELLDKMIGKWKTKTNMMGMVSDGEAEFKWVLGNRFVRQTVKGTMMGQPFEGIGYTGYDNYKNKFNNTWIDTMSTTMNYSEGQLDRSGKVIHFYGTLDEYLTGEHDKAVKYVLDLSKDDEMRFEVHDLIIGEESKVVEVTYTRVDD